MTLELGKEFLVKTLKAQSIKKKKKSYQADFIKTKLLYFKRH